MLLGTTAALPTGTLQCGPLRFLLGCVNEELGLVEAAFDVGVDFVLFLFPGFAAVSNCRLNVTGAGFLLTTNTGFFALSAFALAFASCLAFCHSLSF